VAALADGRSDRLVRGVPALVAAVLLGRALTALEARPEARRPVEERELARLLAGPIVSEGC
jgi:hypothetical protein